MVVDSTGTINESNENDNEYNKTITVQQANTPCTVLTNPPGLQIVVDNSTYTAPQTFNWTPNSSHTLSVSSPQSGTSGTRYVYSSWSDGGAQTHTITVPSSSTTYTANFTTQYTLTTSVNPPGSGTVNPSGSNWYNSGQSVSISATPSSGYSFANWTGDVPNPPNPNSSIQINMNSPKNTTANFTQNQYTLTININPLGSGSVTKNPDKSAYTYNEQVILTATPNPGYSFSNWSGDGSGSVNSVTLTMNGNKTVTANFTQNQYTLSVNINPTGSGSVTKNPDRSTYTYGEQVQITATQNAGYSFSNWGGDASGSVNPVTISMTGNRTVTANFVQNQPTQYTLTVSVNPLSSGSVTKNPDKSTYSDGEQVTLTATPNSGYTFSSWSRVDSSSGTTALVTMVGNRTVTANFTQNPQNQYALTVTVNPQGSGSVSISPSKVTYATGEQVTLTATPYSGYTFSNWSGDAGGTTNPLTLTMNGNKAVTANFTGTTTGADLTGAWSILPTQTCKNTNKGQKCTIKGTLTLSNVGDRDASSFFVSFFVSDNATYEDGDAMLKWVSLGKVKARMSKVIKLNYNFPLGQNASGKYIIAVIDSFNSVSEVDETNNVIAYGPIP